MIIYSRNATDTIIKRLVGEIADELSAGSHAQRQDLLIEIEDGPSGRQGVTVIFDGFDGIPASQRGGIILMAIEKAEDQERALNTSVAMGLTFSDARRLGIPL